MDSYELIRERITVMRRQVEAAIAKEIDFPAEEEFPLLGVKICLSTYKELSRAQAGEYGNSIIYCVKGLKSDAIDHRFGLQAQQGYGMLVLRPG